jgi:hypothetical protein
LTWVGFALAIVYLLLTKRKGIALLCLWLAAVPTAVFCGTYLFSSWADFTRHVDSSLPRLMLQVAPVALLAIGLAISSNPSRMDDLKNPAAGARQS